MDTTLYGVLGVEQSADERAIVDAYRAKAKTHHPDVSDAPDAGAQFKRIQTAREVLTDVDERARYDRLGHEAYVRRYLDPEQWGLAADETSAAATGVSADSSPGTTTHAVGEASPRAAGGATADASSGAAGRDPTRRQYRADGAGTGAAYYRPGERLGVQYGGTSRQFVDALLEVGPWLVAHLLLFVSATTVAALLLTGTSAGGMPSLTGAIVATVMVGTTACLSLLHITSTLFR